MSTKDSIIVANGPTGRNHQWFECGACGRITIDQETMDSHRLKEARCHRFDINAKPFYPNSKMVQWLDDFMFVAVKKHYKMMTTQQLLEHAEVLLEDIETGDLYEQ